MSARGQFRVYCDPLTEFTMFVKVALFNNFYQVVFLKILLERALSSRKNSGQFCTSDRNIIYKYD